MTPHFNPWTFLNKTRFLLSMIKYFTSLYREMKKVFRYRASLYRLLVKTCCKIQKNILIFNLSLFCLSNHNWKTCFYRNFNYVSKIKIFCLTYSTQQYLFLYHGFILLHQFQYHSVLRTVLVVLIRKGSTCKAWKFYRSFVQWFRNSYFPSKRTYLPSSRNPHKVNCQWYVFILEMFPL